MTYVTIKFDVFLEEWHSYVTCADNEMILHVNRMRYPVNQKQVITLKDNRCSGVFNSSHTIIKTSFDQCGTTVEERNNYIIYKNTAKLVVGNDTVAGNGVITRKRIVNIKMECKHEKMINVSTTGAFKPVNASITTTESKSRSYNLNKLFRLYVLLAYFGACVRPWIAPRSK